MLKRTIITGASGWLGSHISDILGEQALSITSPRTQHPQRDNIITCDLSSPNALETLLDQYHATNTKIDSLIHCAGLAHQKNETNSVKTKMLQVNAQGTSNIIDFCKKASIRKLTFISTIAGYDWEQNPMQGMNEDSQLRPQTTYAASKLAAEDAVRASRLDWRVVRLATVFGTGDKANFLKLSKALKRKRFILPGNATERKSVIPVDLAAQLIIEFSEIENPKYRLINLALSEAPTLKQICDSFAKTCDFSPAPTIPLPLLKILAKCGDLAGFIRPMPLNSQIITKLTTSTWVDTQRMEETFKTLPRTSFLTHLQRHSEYYRTA